jgi:hypothetical protein
MAQLVAAGAPELPEGYFYRVRPFMSAGIRVTIRRRRLIGSVEEASALSWPTKFDECGSEFVVSLCQRAYVDMGFQAREAELLRDAKTFIGDHDPRRRK